MTIFAMNVRRMCRCCTCHVTEDVESSLICESDDIGVCLICGSVPFVLSVAQKGAWESGFFDHGSFMEIMQLQELELELSPSRGGRFTQAE